MKIILKYFPDLTPKQIQQFAALEKLYKEWNEKINVISRKDMENFYEHHVLHSLAIASRFKFPAGYHILDIGTGGGFPGLPLAIFFPEVKFYLIDSIKKKLKVVTEIASSIGIKNIITQHTRVEDIKDKQFEVVVSRAVAPLKDLWRWSKPLIDNGKWRMENVENIINYPHGLICLKGGDLKTEIAESNTNSQIFKIEEIFKEDFFGEKYILYIPL